MKSSRKSFFITSFITTLLLSVRYEILTPNAIPRTFMDGKQASELMVSAGIKTFTVDLLNVKEFMAVVFLCCTVVIKTGSVV